MSWKTPSFWYKSKPNIWALLLASFSWLYMLGGYIRQKFSRPYHAGLPVICIGNLVAGGSGKTPSALAILELVKKNGLAQTPHFLTRGYGGDEDKILSQHAPTIVNANRAEGAREAAKNGADLLIMDDGFQNPTLHKDASLIVIDGAMGFGNKCVIPAGPLRQRLGKGLALADGFILIGDDQRELSGLLPDAPRFEAQFTALKDVDKSKDYFAFAGLGYPQKFFAFLEKILGRTLAGTAAFPDHHAYSEDDIQRLHEKSVALGATLITTEKDAVRLPALGTTEIEVLPVKLQWQDEEKLVSFLRDTIKLEAS